jgi:hypothetical protein
MPDTPSLAEWYQTPEPHKELRRLLDETALGVAVNILQERARIGPLDSTDTTQIALQHAIASGYQKALNDLDALSRPRSIIQRKPLPKHFEKPETNPS